MTDEASLSPSKIVSRLDQYIIGQQQAKRMVALAYRNRWRRLQVHDPLMRKEITPKNILMVGPTGVGKTEVARRLAMLTDAPFIKVEATKFTEVGYVGRDVESIIRDLMEIAFKQAADILSRQYDQKAEEYAREELLVQVPWDEDERHDMELSLAAGKEDDDKMVEVDYDPPEETHLASFNILGKDLPPGIGDQLEGLMRNFPKPHNNKQPIRKKMRLGDAMKHFREKFMRDNIPEDRVKEKAIEIAQERGIVFIDEIDKIANDTSRGGIMTGDVSRQGVQRDLLPLVEGTTVQTRFGQIDTTHILFITSGSFHFSKPSDLVPELQGRLPVRVNLDSLSVSDFEAILGSTDNCLVRQYQELLATEGVKVDFSKSALRRIAEIAQEVNSRQENIGARRLHTIMEKLVEEVSFDAQEYAGKSYKFTDKKVNSILGSLLEDEEASRIFL